MSAYWDALRPGATRGGSGGGAAAAKRLMRRNMKTSASFSVVEPVAIALPFPDARMGRHRMGHHRGHGGLRRGRPCRGKVATTVAEAETAGRSRRG